MIPSEALMIIKLANVSAHDLTTHGLFLWIPNVLTATRINMNVLSADYSFVFVISIIPKRPS